MTWRAPSLLLGTSLLSYSIFFLGAAATDSACSLEITKFSMPGHGGIDAIPGGTELSVVVIVRFEEQLHRDPGRTAQTLRDIGTHVT